LELGPGAGARLALDAASVSVLGHEHESRVLRLWNYRPGIASALRPHA
jgi:hypothetical protein